MHKLKIKDGEQGREGPRELGKMFLRLDVRRLPLSRERVMVVTMPTYRRRNTGRVQEVHWRTRIERRLIRGHGGDGCIGQESLAACDGCSS